MVGFLNNAIEVANESFVLIVFWLLFLFTDYIEDPEKRYKYGYDLIYAVAVVISLNFVTFIFALVQKIYTSLRIWLKKRKIQARMRKIKDAKQEKLRD